jgi:hypothetical protein
MGYETAVQQAVYDKLSADTAVTSLVEGIFDSVPQGQAYPYITIGEDVHTEWDTATTDGSSCSISIHVWSRAGQKRGRMQTKEIQGAIYESLHKQELSLTGWDFVGVDCETSSSFVDQDGLTRHGVQIFRILIERA